MSRPIICLVCQKPLGELASGTKILPGTVHLCQEDGEKLRAKASKADLLKAAKAFNENRRADYMGSVFEELGKIFGK